MRRPTGVHRLADQIVGLGGLVGNRLDGAFKDVAITAGHFGMVGAGAYTMHRQKETWMGGAVMNTERWSALLSLVPAFVIVAASYFQWWDVTYDGGLLTR